MTKRKRPRKAHKPQFGEPFKNHKPKRTWVTVIPGGLPTLGRKR
jgi:hypothetical protein